MHTKLKSTVFVTALALVATASANSVYAAEAKGISGRWISPDNSILTIRGSEWSSPRGTASIHRTHGNTFRVEYDKDQGTKCLYRINTAAGGDIMVLEAADKTQSLESCPNGRFTRSDQ
jgi:hypothetical protein